MTAAADKTKKDSKRHNPFRAAILRGLAVVLPPLLTIVIFLWIGATVGQYAFEPLMKWTRSSVVWYVADIRPENTLPKAERGEEFVEIDGEPFVRADDATYVPLEVYETVLAKQRNGAFPQTGTAIYNRYVQLTYLRPWLAIPTFVLVFTVALYLLGRFMAAGAGRFFWNLFERGVGQVPLVRNVYNAVKQVSDFVLAQQDIEFSRVVAVEWPRKGVWVLSFVTGESIPDIEAAANEPVLSVLVPTSPMPMTGFTVTVKKSETIDLSISFDQAFQFIVSCGVAVPPQCLHELTVDQHPVDEPHIQQPDSAAETIILGGPKDH